MLNKIFLISLFFVLSVNTEIYAGLYEDLNEIRKSKLENFSKSSKTQSKLRKAFGGEYSDPFDIIILDFEIFLIEIIENKGNFKNIIDKYLMNKSRTKELSLETRILLAKYFADDFIHNMKIVYYAHIKNFCDALSKDNTSHNEEYKKFLEENKDKMHKKAIDYFGQAQEYSEAQFALEKQISSALNKLNLGDSFKNLFSYIKEEKTTYKYYEDIKKLFLERKITKYNEDFVIKSNVNTAIKIDSEIKFFEQGEIEKKEKEKEIIPEPKRERKRDKVKNFFKSITK
ncbi:hypothetical protein HE1_00571 [Holospora elegans E1]|uniref:Uncharacterized protein n=1 Tax=Holospora elegans E1 TaxID=1427503 RepID=A0A023DZ04_9PROT|nr:hypothetical protein [Holospora elegans]GAJ46245.1 hypothetical protein HE1_00571 [Holospora elegans E1]